MALRAPGEGRERVGYRHTPPLLALHPLLSSFVPTPFFLLPPSSSKEKGRCSFLEEMLTYESPKVTAMIPSGWKGFLPTLPPSPTLPPKTLMLPFMLLFWFNHKSISHEYINNLFDGQKDAVRWSAHQSGSIS